jgi:tetratricopeptide (TPR) repeat protein
MRGVSMSEPQPSGAAQAHDAVPDAKIEQLLLAGLDHYFAGRYQQAIDVWTRAFFFDRDHPRARAYIERARSALAERQRESEELLQKGVAAFHRGDASEARRLLTAAIDGGAPSDEALAVLGRLDRLEFGARPAEALRLNPSAAASV